jgi:hypothetical protein
MSDSTTRDRPGDGASRDDDRELPVLDFATFVMSVIGSAFIHLGDAPDPDDPEAGQGEPNLLLAEQDIQLLTLLQEKTKGNLSGEEERVLNRGLDDLRLRYVEVQNTVR